MLNREQAMTIAVMRRQRNGIFKQLPKELVRHICTFGRNNTSAELNIALHHAAFGELNELKMMLEAAKQKAQQAKTEEDKEALTQLLLPIGTTETPGGLTVKNSQLLECVTLNGDPVMKAMIKPYFSEFKGGEEEMERQMARIRPCIDAVKTQQPEDLTCLFNIIKAASAQDVAEELKTGDQYNKTYQSPLRDALNQWRQAKLAPANRVIDVLKAPRMFCNYQNWIHVNAFLEAEWDKNQWADLITNENNYDKIYLILRQLRGLLELLELPVCERFAFANGQVENPAAQIVRALKYKYSDGSFPHFDRSSLESHTGLGFDFFVNIFGGGEQEGGGATLGNPRLYLATARFKTYVEQKLQTCRTYAAATAAPSSNIEPVCNRLK